MSHHDIDPIETLRAELSRVHVSPDFAERVRRQIAEDPIASLESELSDLSVSPQFAVRVRQQIEAAPARSPLFGLFNWRWAVPAAAAAVVLVAIAISRSGNPETSGVRPVAVTGRGPDAPQAPATSTVLPTIQSDAPAQRTHDARVARVTQRTASPAVASSQQTEEKFEVITNQPAILQDWWARVGQGQVLSEATDEAVAADMDTRDVVITPVEVNPLVVKWLVEPPAAVAIPFPFIRRVAAEWAERSSR
jgi:hypothetical protein